MRSCFLQDAHCEVPSDYLDQGESDLSVPTVPEGFMREVVIHFEADTPSSSATLWRPTPSVFYHYFTSIPGVSKVRRKALLRAPANPDDADAEGTVEGFLRSELNQMALEPSSFNFDAKTDGPRVLPAALPATALACQSKAAPTPSHALSRQPTAASRRNLPRATKPQPGSTSGTSTPSTTAATQSTGETSTPSTTAPKPAAAKKRAAPAAKGAPEKASKSESCAECKASKKGQCGTERAFSRCQRHPHGAKTGAAAAAEEEDATCVSLCGVSCYIIRLLQEPVLSLWSAARHSRVLWGGGCSGEGAPSGAAHMELRPHGTLDGVCPLTRGEYV